MERTQAKSRTEGSRRLVIQVLSRALQDNTRDSHLPSNHESLTMRTSLLDNSRHASPCPCRPDSASFGLGLHVQTSMHNQTRTSVRCMETGINLSRPLPPRAYALISAPIVCLLMGDVEFTNRGDLARAKYCPSSYETLCPLLPSTTKHLNYKFMHNVRMSLSAVGGC